MAQPGQPRASRGQPPGLIGLHAMPVDQKFGKHRAAHGSQRKKATTGTDGGQDGVFVGGEQQNQHPIGWLLQCFEQRVGGFRAESLGAVEDDNGPTAFHRPAVGGLHHLPDFVNPDPSAARLAGFPLLQRYDADVGVDSATNAGAGGALSARAGSGITATNAVDGSGQINGQVHLADVGWAGEQVGVGQPTGLQAGGQRPQQMILTDC